MNSRFTGEQIIGVLEEVETGVKVAELCRKLGISGRKFPGRSRQIDES